MFWFVWDGLNEIIHTNSRHSLLIVFTFEAHDTGWGKKKRQDVSLTRVTKSYLSALGTTQIRSRYRIRMIRITPEYFVPDGTSLW